MKRDEIIHFIAGIKPKLVSEGIISLGLFGSYAKGKETEASDIDILVETSDRFIQNYPGWEAISRLEEIRQQISDHFGGIHVDICDKAGLSERGKKYILSEVEYV